jgi:hypothetical protein
MSKTHGTVLRHWNQFRSFANRPATLQVADLERDLREFVGYLLSLRACGGSTIKSYLTLLPAALAGSQSLTSPQFTLPHAIRRLLDVVAKEVAPKYPLDRSAATLATIRSIAEDSQIRAAVRAAVVVQYHLGFRGINVYITKKGSKERALHWGDCTQAGQGKMRTWTIRVRKEKTAKVHVGSFPDKVLAISEHTVMPCPVKAMDEMWENSISRGKADCVFTGVNYKQVSAALKQHSPEGQRLSPHSIRIGAASDVNAAGLSERVLQLKGNWATPQSANRYIRGSAQASKREMHAVASMADISLLQQTPSAHAILAQPAAADDLYQRQLGIPLPFSPAKQRPSPTVGALHNAILHNEQDDVLLLMLQHARGKWRAYFYDTASHSRCLKNRLHGGRYLGHYEPFTHAQLPRLLKHVVAYDGDKKGQLQVDSRAVCQSDSTYAVLRDRPNPVGRHSSL